MNEHEQIQPKPVVTGPKKPHKEKRKSSGTLRFILSMALALAFVLLFVNPFIIQTYQVYGQSMEPTLHEDDYLIISKVGVSLSKLKHKDFIPKRGEIIVIDSSVNGTRLIKRVIGLPGERVVVESGNVKVFPPGSDTGFDPYQQLGLPGRFTSGNLSVVVPEGHIFVIGDNRQAGGSLDSRNELGAVPTDKVVGRLLVRLWPFSQPTQSSE